MYGSKDGLRDLVAVKSFVATDDDPVEGIAVIPARPMEPI